MSIFHRPKQQILQVRNTLPIRWIESTPTKVVSSNKQTNRITMRLWRTYGPNCGCDVYSQECLLNVSIQKSSLIFMLEGKKWNIYLTKSKVFCQLVDNRCQYFHSVSLFIIPLVNTQWISPDQVYARLHSNTYAHIADLGIDA